LAVFLAGFLVAALSCCALAALTASQRFFVAAMIAFLPAAESFRLAFDGSGNGGLACFTGGFFAVPEGACKLTASFARVTAAFAF